MNSTNSKAYIESGILELYVAGSLSEEENKEVYDAMLKHPEILQEVISIESSIVKLTSALSPSISKGLFNSIKGKIGLSQKVDTPKVITMTKPKTNWLQYTGWAASLFLAAGLFWVSNQNNDLQNQISTFETDKEFLEQQIEIAKSDLKDSKNLVEVLRDRDIISVPLTGQAVSPTAYANVYWDKDNNSIYLDAQGLPEPPKGKVYQIWSLTLNPLTPTNLGTIDDFTTDENKIFAIGNTNESQAFGITLEPAGGSEGPTLEQLYTLGVISATP